MKKSEFRRRLPLLSILNNEMDNVIRWCTPSINPRVMRVRGIYECDMSVSYHGLGNPSLDTGIFHKAHKLAAKAYGADFTLFSVNGTTGSNFVVTRALKAQLGKVNMLAQRNVHKSMSVAIEDYGITVNFLPPHYDDKSQIFVPNSLREILNGIKSHPETNVLFLTNPTYEGFSSDLGAIVDAVRRVNPRVIIYIDEAWGSHFHFSKKLPPSAMSAGADIAVQSTHKQGSGLQQTAMIHWKKGRVKRSFILDSFKSIMSTSPSFHLLASLDAARFLMETDGASILDDLLSVASLFRNSIADVKGVKVINLDFVSKKYPQVRYSDGSKVLINVKGTGHSGYEIAHLLETRYGVVVEKYEVDNMLFLNTFQNKVFEANQTVELFKKTLSDLGQKKQARGLEFPKFPVDIRRRFISSEVTKKRHIQLTLKRSIGNAAAEDIVPYPPGIPLIMKGELIQQSHIDYLDAIRRTKGLISLVIQDASVKSVMTVRD